MWILRKKGAKYGNNGFIKYQLIARIQCFSNLSLADVRGGKEFHLGTSAANL